MLVDSSRILADRMLAGYLAVGRRAIDALGVPLLAQQPDTRLAYARHQARHGLMTGAVGGSLTAFLLPPSLNQLGKVAPAAVDTLVRAAGAWPCGALLPGRCEPLWWPYALVGRGRLPEGIDTLGAPNAAGERRRRSVWSLGAQVLLSYGLLGVPQYLFEHAAASCEAGRYRVAAFACLLGAAGIAWALELPRIVCTLLQCTYLTACGVVAAVATATALGAMAFVTYRPGRC